MHQFTRRAALAVLAISALAAAGCGGSSGGSSSTPSGGAGGSVVINGAGSTFAQPMYQQWAGEYAQKVDPKVKVNYQGIGSGGGIAEFTQGIIDFGGTDAPMSADEQKAAEQKHGPVLHIPMILGAVAVIYNEPGVKSLKLDGPTLADIYQGKITKWNDPKIAALNPGVSLPGDSIQVVERSDSSGTSFIFTSYLTAVSPAWSSKVGADKAPQWPTGTGAQGSSGVAAAVQQTKGAIGYVEYGYASQNSIPFASLKSASGDVVAPSADSTTAAASGVSYPDDLKFSLINSKSAGAYPIVSATWILVAQNQKDKTKGPALVRWMQWCLQKTQQAEVANLGYAPLPSDLDGLAIKAVSSITVP
ncbi:MAG: phosphate ABC transporter substrate-binding protein PstS [Gaiellales bacterium]